LERLDTIYAKRGRFVLNDLREAFSVDALSDEFFKKYHDHYDDIVAELTRQGKSGAVYHDYVKKLMGRIVFLHFLQKKGWLVATPTSCSTPSTKANARTTIWKACSNRFSSAFSTPNPPNASRFSAGMAGNKV
jgi:hypothetical protein